MNKIPVIFGVAGLELTNAEISFFKLANPFGYIIFKRNVESKSQLTDLIESIKSLDGNANTPILIDQEGGRVARLRPPIMDEYPSAATFGKIAETDLEKAKKMVFLNYYNLGLGLKSFGINVNCAPVADLIIENAHNVIGDRSFSSSITVTSQLCEAAVYGMISAGVQPIIKHIPGHGRAMCDSHYDLPKVKLPLNILQETDFKVFKNLCNLPTWAMTAHIVYSALDDENCLTNSKRGIEFIRNDLGYQHHLILSDDVSMKALKKSVELNTIDALNAGCDLVLHCNGQLDEMENIYKVLNERNFTIDERTEEHIHIPDPYQNYLSELV